MSQHNSYDNSDSSSPSESLPSQGTPPATPTQGQDMPAKTNLFAVLSLVFSFFMQLIGLIFGIVALNQIKKTGEGGKGLAIAGIIISAIGILIGLFIGFLFFLGILAASSLPDDTRSDTGSSSLEGKKATNTPEVAVGKSTTIGDLKVKVISVKEPKLDDFEKPKAGNIYLNVELEVANDGYETEYISATQAYIKDSKNNKYNYSIFAVPSGEPSISGELASNDSVRGKIGFEVPDDAKNLKLYFEGTDYNGAAAVINLGR